MSITIDDVKDKLLTLDQVRERLAHTEPLSTYDFDSESVVGFHLEPDFNHGLKALPGNLPIPGFISLGQTQLQLTRDALYEAASAAKLVKGFVQTTPANIVEEVLNWYFNNGAEGKEFKVLGIAGDKAAAITRGAVQPYSNLRLLETTLDRIEAKYGRGEVFADYKFVHDLQRTHMRLIIPEYVRTIEDTGTDNDTWSVGIQVKNSLTGLEQTEISGYLFRYWCTNGAIDTRHNVNSVWSRRGAAGRDEDAVFEWAREEVDAVLGGLEGSLDAIQAMTKVSIDGTAVDELRTIFRDYGIPTAQRNRILGTMVNETNMTMYSLMQAVTEAANADNISATDMDRLMRAGGDMPMVASDSRCTPEEPCGRFIHAH